MSEPKTVTPDEAAAPHMRQAFFLEMNACAVEDEVNAPSRGE